MENTNPLDSQWSRELKLKEELISLIREYSDRQGLGFPAELKEKCREFSGLVNAIVSELESSRRQCLKLEQDKLRVIMDGLIKKRLFSPEIKGIIESIDSELKRDFINDGNFLAQINGQQAQPQIGDVNLAGLSASIRGSFGSANEASRLDAIKREVSEFSKLPFVKRVLARSRREKLKEDTIKLLQDYERDFEKQFVATAQIDTAEYKLYRDINSIYLGLQTLAHYLDIKQEMYIINSGMAYIRRSVSADISLEARDEDFIRRFEAEIREKEKSSLALSLLRPEDAEGHAGKLIETGIAVHLTDYFPRRGLIQTSRNAIYMPHLKYNSSRDTIHFAINHAVQPVPTLSRDALFDWSGKKYAVLIPLSKMPLDRMISLHETDTFFAGSIKIPEGGLIVARSEHLNSEVIGKDFKDVDSLISFFRGRGIGVIILEGSKNLTRDVNSIVAKMGRAIYQKALNDNGSEAHFSGEWGMGGFEAMSNGIVSLRSDLAQLSSYCSSQISYIPNWRIVGSVMHFFTTVRSAIFRLEYLNNSNAMTNEKKKVLLDIIEMATSTMRQMEAVLDMQYESIKGLKRDYAIPENDKLAWDSLIKWLLFIKNGLTKEEGRTLDDELSRNIWSIETLTKARTKIIFRNNPGMERELSDVVKILLAKVDRSLRIAEPIYKARFPEGYINIKSHPDY